MRRGFTLIELLVVIAIIAVLVALLLPAVQQAREAARRTQCRNNLHQLAIAFANYAETHGVFPPADTSGEPNQAGWHRADVGWGVLLLPFIEEAPLYRQYDFNIAAVSGPNVTLSKSYIKQYECPTQGNGDELGRVGRHAALGAPEPNRAALTSYHPCWGTWGSPWGNRFYPQPGTEYSVSGISFVNSAVTVGSIHDGTSQTIMLGETLSSSGNELVLGVEIGGYGLIQVWAGTDNAVNTPDGTQIQNNINGMRFLSSGTGIPMNTLVDNWSTDSGYFGSRHEGGAFFAFADSQVRFISENVDFLTYRWLSTRAGSEVIDDKDY